MIVQIRKKFRESLQERNRSTIVNGIQVGSTKAVSYGFKYMIPIDPATKKLKLGFEQLIDNPYYTTKEEDVNLPSNWVNSTIWKTPRITKQTYFELKHDKPQGFYNFDSFDISKYDSATLKKKQRTYLQTFSYTLKDGTTELNLDNADDEIMYQVILANPQMFAPSHADLENSQSAEFYISNIEVEEEVKASQRKVIVKAIADYNKLLTEYGNQLQNFIVVLKISKEKLSTEIAENRLYDYINDSTISYSKKQSDRIEEFNKYFKLISSKNVNDKLSFKMQVFLQQLINYRVVTDYQDKYLWASKQGSNLHTLGRNKTEVLSFLMDSANEAYVKELEGELDIRI